MTGGGSGARWIHRHRNGIERHLTERGLTLLREGRQRLRNGESIVAVTRSLALRSNRDCYTEE